MRGYIKCPYCSKQSRIPIVNSSIGGEPVEMEINPPHSMLFAINYKGYSIEINYCPMCGEELKEGKHKGGA